ncbi:MAG: CRISPR-associated endonuclease Cas2 [Thermoplasmata archaeon]
MRNVFLVTYDIMDPKRWSKVHRTMKGFGEPLQYSVFACDLADAQRVLMVAALERLIKADTDRVIIVNLGPAEGNAADRVTFLGRQGPLPERGPVIV